MCKLPPISSGVPPRLDMVQCGGIVLDSLNSLKKSDAGCSGPAPSVAPDDPPHYPPPLPLCGPSPACTLVPYGRDEAPAPLLCPPLGRSWAGTGRRSCRCRSRGLWHALRAGRRGDLADSSDEMVPPGPV